MFLYCLLLAITLSLDCICIGITYGIKKTYITPIAKCIIFTIFVLVATTAVTIGKFIIIIFPLEYANILGVVLLVLMGIWIIYQSFKPKKETKANHKEKIYKLIIKPLGLTIQIIKNPTSSDLDHSNHIDAKEAIYLGFAISLDAFCAGVGCSVIGINLLLFPLLTASFHILFLTIGFYFGFKFSKATKIPDNIWSAISGLLLIGLGVFKLF